MDNQIEILEKQLNSISERISSVEKRYKELRDNDLKFSRPKSAQPKYSPPNNFKNNQSNNTSPFAFLHNLQIQPKTPLQKLNSPLALAPSVNLILPSDSSEDSDDYFSGDGDGAQVVSIEEVQKNLPPKWVSLIEMHNKETAPIFFGSIKQITHEDMDSFFA